LPPVQSEFSKGLLTIPRALLTRLAEGNTCLAHRLYFFLRFPLTISQSSLFADRMISTDYIPTV